MSRFFPAFLLCATLALAAGNVPAATGDAAGLDFFEKKIRPVLAEYCYECHSHQAKKLKGGLYLDSRAGTLQGGDTGVAVVLGEPEKSRLMEAISYSNPDLQMPPKQKLPERVIADLREWIKLGAPWPEEALPKTANAVEEERSKQEQQRKHWAWQPIRVEKPTQVKNKNWARSQIDLYVLAKLEEQGLSPAPPADPRVLIRRAYFDLIGLPPTVEEIKAFLEDRSPAAFGKVIDRLLASPHYGERFGRDWLDVARYGEDQAHSFQPRLYPQGYRYRDWVIQAFNQDMPYDRFVLEQIAADLLEGPDRMERLSALGFFALGPVYYGDKKMFDQFDDRIDTLTRGFLGLTVACARCHDHKYDPITTSDYYALAGIFASSQYVEAPLAPKEVVEKYDMAQKNIEAKTKAIDTLLEEETARLNKVLAADMARYVLASWKLYNQRKEDPHKTPEQLAKGEGLISSVLDRWSKYLGSQRDRPHLGQWREMLARQDPQKDLGAEEAALNEARKVAETFQAYVLAIRKLRDAVNESATAALAITTETDKEKLPKLSLDKAQTALLEDIFGAEGLAVVTKKQVEKLLPENLALQISELRTALAQLKKEAPVKYPLVHALKEAEKLTNLPVLIRGNADKPGEEVPRRFLTLLGGHSPATFTNGSGRLELARAIADKNNPLTPRVMVNRIWQHHFGQGIVRTPGNFGLLGEPPVQPQLLDYLSDQLINSRWSLKTLHRQIMLSSVYQMSGEFNERHHQMDPENKYLWRMNRRRLEVESWRDAMLAIAGNLDPTVGGPSLSLASPENRRRTVYAAVSRHELDQLLRLFDFPDPNVTSDKRTVTTVPLQQLFVLNSEFMVRQAKALARRLTEKAEEANVNRLRHAFLLVYGRLPGEHELKLGLEFLTGSDPAGAASDQPETHVLSRWEQYAQVLLSANEFMYVD